VSVVIFCGPTLGTVDLAPYPHFEIRPPVRQGELYAAAQGKPVAIGIVDGYFDGVPAVWHKEVLWALQAGIAVFGAASMGALRAAELHAFGMRGIGRIFEDYRDGRLTDDDEVALLHGPAEAGYVTFSEPMVNIRATLDRAVTERVIASRDAKRIAAIAKARFYQERTWTSVLEESTETLPRKTIDRFAAWLPSGRVDRKREDALELLRAVDDFVRRGERQPPASFSFEWTETWANAPWLNADASRPPDWGDGGEEAAILDELRLDGEAYQRVRRAALLRVLAREEATRNGQTPDRKEVARTATRFRSPRGLARQSDVEQWARENDLKASHFDRLMAGDASLEKLARMRDAALRDAMLDQLRLADAYPKLRRRARAKARVLAKGAKPKLEARHPLLLSWYFGTRLKRDMPDDLQEYAAAIGISDMKAFYALIAAEYALAAQRAQRKGSGRSRK
jgi:hypothetical protein